MSNVGPRSQVKHTLGSEHWMLALGRLAIIVFLHAAIPTFSHQLVKRFLKLTGCTSVLADQFV
jgi:hypothetical protein